MQTRSVFSGRALQRCDITTIQHARHNYSPCVFCKSSTCIIATEFAFSVNNYGHFPDLLGVAVVGLSGLEPPTSRLSGVRSNQLSYKPMFDWPEAIGYLCHIAVVQVSLLLRLYFVHNILGVAVVEINGIEPLTSCLQSRRSPS